MTNFREQLDKAAANLSGRDKKPVPAQVFNVTEVDIPLDIQELTPTQLALKRLANLNVELGSAKNTVSTRIPLEGKAATSLLDSIPHELRSELKIMPSITEDGKVLFVMKSGAYVNAVMREFHGEAPKPQQDGNAR